MIAADGKYTIDVSDLTPPFMMRADGNVGGRHYSLYSAAAVADINGTVNITPLTDLIVSNIASQIAETIYNNGDFSGMTTDALNQAETELQMRLQPILTAVGLADSIDLLRATFNADHLGLDGVLDILRVTTDPVLGEATILNIITNQQIIDDLASQADTTILDDTTGVVTGLTDTQQIIAGFDAFSSRFATALPASDDATLIALFDGANFLLDGQDLNAFLSEITTDPQLIGITFNVTFNSLTPVGAPTSARVSFSVINADGSEECQTGCDDWLMNKVDGIWLIAGNQRIAQAWVDTFARNDSTGIIDTGLRMEIQDEGGRRIDYAIVKGKGLPTTTGGADGISAGALLVNFTNDSSFRLAQADAAYAGINTPSITSGHNQFPLLDEAISVFGEDEVYTVELWDDPDSTPSDLSDDTLLASYTNVIGKRPYLNSELSAASFPTITTTPAAIGAFATAGGNLTVTWILPIGLQSEEVHFSRNGGCTGIGSCGADSESTNNTAASTATSILLTIGAPTFTVEGSGINLSVLDGFGRELETQLNGEQ